MPGAKILIVEDELIISLEIKETLRRLGYEVIGRVISGEEAIQKAGETNPDLILMDIRLAGEMDGITAAKRIIDLYDIPVIFLTAHSDEATLKKAIEVSPSGYLLKPFNDRELLTNIEMSLHKNKVKKRIRSEKTSVPSYIINQVTGSKNPVLFISPELKVTDINKATEEIFSLPALQIIKKPIFELFSSASGVTDELGEKESLQTGTQIILPDQMVLNTPTKGQIPITISLGFILKQETELSALIAELTTQGTEISGREGKGGEGLTESFINSFDIPAFVIGKDKIITSYNSSFFDLCKQAGISKFQLERPIFETKRMSLFGDTGIYDEIFRTGFPNRQVKKFSKYKEKYYIHFVRFGIKTKGNISHVVSLMFDVTEEYVAKEEAKKVRILFQSVMETIEKTLQTSSAVKPLVTRYLLESRKTQPDQIELNSLIEEIGESLKEIDLSVLEYSGLKEALLEKTK